MNLSLMRRWCGVLLLVLLAGCSQTGSPGMSQDEEQVRATFAAFKSAMKARDADRIWDLLDDESRATAERLGKNEKKPVTAKEFLASDRFHGQLHEVPSGEIIRVNLQGNKATVIYSEPNDNDEEKLLMVREQGRWRVSPPME
jgi:hypothetical protein